MASLLSFYIKIFLASLLIISAYSMKFTFVLEPYKRNCIGEYITENTVAIVNLQAGNAGITCQVYNPSQNLIYQKENQKTVKVSVTASESGNYQMCITNNIKTSIEISFEFLSGIAAKDYSEVAKESNLKPVEISLQKLEDMIKYLIQEMLTVMKQDESDLAINDSLSGKIILFSIITLLAMIVVGVIETVYIQRYLHKRKII